jgi:hypothetical protein
MPFLHTKKSLFVHIMEDFGMENVGMFDDSLVYFTATWYIL